MYTILIMNYFQVVVGVVVVVVVGHSKHCMHSVVPFLFKVSE
jgi:hypothetical protein